MKFLNATKVPFFVRITAIVSLLLMLASVTLFSGCSKSNGKEEDIPTIQIETPFGALDYPEKWADKVRTQWNGTQEAGNITFSSKLDGKDEIALFQVHFAEEAQMPVGRLQTAEHQGVSVGISFLDITFDGEWTEAEKDEIYAMQEDVNVIIQKMEEKGFIANKK